MTRVINEAGLDIIKHHERCELTSYPDRGGVPTRGWGHTGPDVALGQTITQQQADDDFDSDLRNAEGVVSRFIVVPLTDNQFSALVCLVFNIGSGDFERSHVRSYLNGKQYHSAAGEFDKWIYVKGVQSEELIRRRAEERALFEL